MTEEERQRERRRETSGVTEKTSVRKDDPGYYGYWHPVCDSCGSQGIAGRLLSSSDSSDKKTAVNASDASISVKDSQTTEKASSEASAKGYTLKAAKRKAAQYDDYDGAMELLKKDASYSSNSDMQNAVKNTKRPKLPVNHGHWKK